MRIWTLIAILIISVEVAGNVTEITSSKVETSKMTLIDVRTKDTTKTVNYDGENLSITGNPTKPIFGTVDFIFDVGNRPNEFVWKDAKLKGADGSVGKNSLPYYWKRWRAWGREKTLTKRRDYT